MRRDAALYGSCAEKCADEAKSAKGRAFWFRGKRSGEWEREDFETVRDCGLFFMGRAGGLLPGAD
jgi:hypothetical protein